MAGFDGADGAGCVSGFAVGTCDLLVGGSVPGVIAAEGVGLGFVAGLALCRTAAGGASGATAAEGVDADGFAAGNFGGGVLRFVPLEGDGADVPGVTAAEGVVALGVCAAGVPGLAPPTGADDDGPGDVAAEGDVGATDFVAGTCDGAVDGVLGDVAAEGAVGVAGLPVGDGSG